MKIELQKSNGRKGGMAKLYKMSGAVPFYTRHIIIIYNGLCSRTFDNRILLFLGYLYLFKYFFPIDSSINNIWLPKFAHEWFQLRKLLNLKEIFGRIEKGGKNREILESLVDSLTLL
ncbi:hypothetical protein Nepgr_016958 [Nepenthes gracilis]|uniref:Uncharacterized protein n=1 Tax=Nepenthes gracilis TaxID=150966 RepID=A0AAD3XRR7_NEPGR|nr:hypothetical protein Nepgr_016958 [Nepenthes gracilis]